MRNNGLLDILLFWLSISEKYDKLKKDPDKQDSVSLGVSSIVTGIFGILATIGFAYLAYLAFTVDGLAIVLTFLLGVMAIIIAVACFFMLSVASIIYAAYQMKLNKRAIGKVALALSLILIAAVIIGIIILLTVVVK